MPNNKASFQSLEVWFWKGEKPEMGQIRHSSTYISRKIPGAYLLVVSGKVRSRSFSVYVRGSRNSAHTKLVPIIFRLIGATGRLLVATVQHLLMSTCPFPCHLACHICNIWHSTDS